LLGIAGTEFLRCEQERTLLLSPQVQPGQFLATRISKQADQPRSQIISDEGHTVVVPAVPSIWNRTGKGRSAGNSKLSLGYDVHRVSCAGVFICSNSFNSVSGELAAVPVAELSIADDPQSGSLESLLRREMPEITIGRSSGTTELDARGWETVVALYVRLYFSPGRDDRGQVSFDRFHDLLTVPLCGWPMATITTVANERNPDLVTDLLITQFAGSARTRALS